MPRKKTVSKKKTVNKKIEAKPQPVEIEGSAKQKKERLLSKKNIIILAVVILGLIFWRAKNYFIVATINGQPISRWELSGKLMSQFGGQILDNLITERLIIAGARQKGIFVTSDEIDGKVKEVEERLAGQASLEDALKMQGIDIPTFKRQIELQLSIEKMFADQATVSAQEIDEFIENNQEYLSEATDPAKLRSDVEESIKQQKITELFDGWFSEIKQNANIKKYL